MKNGLKRDGPWSAWPSRWIERTRGTWGARRPREVGPPAKVIEFPGARGIEDREKKGNE